MNDGVGIVSFIIANKQPLKEIRKSLETELQRDHFALAFNVIHLQSAKTSDSFFVLFF